MKARELLPFTEGINVVVQGANNKWENTGRIVNVLPNRQYKIRMFHSGRMTLRNRRFLREYSPITREAIQW